MSLSISEAERRRTQRQHALEQHHSIENDKVLTFREWCALNAIGERTGRRIIKSPGGPIVTQLSERRIGIRISDNRAWQASRARG
jgi:hypothetical protein